jgi:hypothetical protein
MNVVLWILAVILLIIVIVCVMSGRPSSIKSNSRRMGPIGMPWAGADAEFQRGTAPGRPANPERQQ